MSTLAATPFELIVNPEDAEPSRAWVLEKIADPDVVAACIMHGQASDKVDAELINAAGENVKCISTFSVGYGESRPGVRCGGVSRPTLRASRARSHAR